MSGDPFERFERSRGGLLIPVLLFIFGAVPTAMAIRAMSNLAVMDEPPQVVDPNELKPEVNAEAAADDPERRVGEDSSMEPSRL